MGEILERCQPIALSLIRSKATSVYEPENELLAAVNEKLLWSLPRFDPERGRAFAFVSRTVLNTLCTRVTYQRKMASRFPPLDDTLVATVPDESAAFNSPIALSDLTAQIRRSIRSSCSAEHERAAQRWCVESFIDSGFEMRRHEVSDAAMKVYGLTHRRSRQLYDQTLLEIRRTVWDETLHREADPNQLKGTKGLPLVRYTNFLTRDEFSKLVNLMRDLVPSLVMLVKLANEARIRAGEWGAVRENLLFSKPRSPNKVRTGAGRLAKERNGETAGATGRMYIRRFLCRRAFGEFSRAAPRYRIITADVRCTPVKPWNGSWNWWMSPA
jgi:hypothetical protein